MEIQAVNKWMMSLMALFAFAISPAFGASYEGDNVTKSVTRAGKNLRGSGQFSVNIDTKIYSVVVLPELVDELVYDCEDAQLTDGREGNWKEFFEAPKDLKAAALAAAIKGVGQATAMRLVADGYFADMPRSWKEFATRVSTADLQYHTGFSYSVLVTYKKENMISLGYLVEGQCGYKTVRTTKLVPHRTFARELSKQFQLIVNSAPLLVGEQENFNVSFDGFADTLSISSSYNDYNVARTELPNGVVLYQASGRRRVLAPTNSLNVYLHNAGGYLILNVSDANFDAEVDAQGARTINRAALGCYDAWRARRDLAVHHVCGPRHVDACAAELAAARRSGDALKYELVGYEERMDLLYGRAALAVCRAGAGTIAELTAVGLPAVLVPLPGAPSDHQTRNAQTLERAGAAVMLSDDECDPARLDKVVSELLGATDRLERMSLAARGLGRRDATERLSDLVEEHAGDA